MTLFAPPYGQRKRTERFAGVRGPSPAVAVAQAPKTGRRRMRFSNRMRSNLAVAIHRAQLLALEHAALADPRASHSSPSALSAGEDAATPRRRRRGRGEERRLPSSARSGG